MAPLVPPPLAPYWALLEKWMPMATADIRLEPDGGRFDAAIIWKTPAGPARYLVEEKKHLRFQDVHVIADQLVRRRQEFGPKHADDRLMLLAPHVRLQHAAVLERAHIDYVDLAGNAHLETPGLFVHVEGRQPPKPTAQAPGRPQKGWVKVVMALLVRPDLATQPYRVVAQQADTALGTVAQCLTDLTARGLLVETKGTKRIVDRQALVALWVQAYVDVLRPKLRERRLQIKAKTKQEVLARLGATLDAQQIPWALTGADAAERQHHFFHAEDTEIYAPVDLIDRDMQKALIAQPVDRGGNLVVIEPPGPTVVVANPQGTPVAPDLLVYAELRYRGTDQALEAAEMLLPQVLQ